MVSDGRFPVFCRPAAARPDALLANESRTCPVLLMSVQEGPGCFLK